MKLKFITFTGFVYAILELSWVGYWLIWSSTPSDDGSRSKHLFMGDSNAYENSELQADGLSVRCVEGN